MKLIILTNDYPSQDNLYANGFIHRRVLEYIKQGHQVNIYISNKEEKKQYIYEGVEVFQGNSEDFIKYLYEFKPESILVHFIDRHMMKTLAMIEQRCPVLVWIHGAEALGWYRRIFNLNVSTKEIIEFWKYSLGNIRALLNLRKFVLKNRVKFIFVSYWMKKIMETDIGLKVKDYEVIPNIVDKELFEYNNKIQDQRKNILLIRPFASKKYATDVAVKAIIELSKREVFKDLKFTIVGDGKLYKKHTQKIIHFENVTCINRFLSQKEIYEYHQQNGIFLCPTRQDSQGVSMCEAMSSGLVPITSNNTAIPEFVEDGISGFLTNNFIEIADRIEQLYNDKDLFSKMSQNASRTIGQKCSYEKTVLKELDIIEKYINT